MSAYYNEIDPYCVAWLRNLIGAKLIADGTIDDRSIKEVAPQDLAGFSQCHFFAGIGGWSYALRLAGWPDTRSVWTGSCPCQPFSQAGKRRGVDDERHLWPEFLRLIQQSAVERLLGEQVASTDGRQWLAGIQADLEALGFEFGAADLCAAGVAAPHIRQRLFWLADRSGDRVESEQLSAQGREHISNTNGNGTITERVAVVAGEQVGSAGQPWIHPTGVGDTNGHHGHWWSGPVQVGWNAIEAEVERSGRKYRAQWRIKPGVPFVANGVPARVAKLCAIGNAIVPQVAAEFIKAFMSCRP